MLYTRYHKAAELGEGKEVLEVACGPGVGLGYLARKAKRVVGGDYDERLLRVARQHYGNRFELTQMDAQSLPFKNESFDVVLLLEAIYYLPQPARFVDEARRVLRKGGGLFICSANRERDGFNRSPHSHTYFSASEVQALLHRKGFDTELFAGFPVRAKTFLSRILSVARRLAVALHLIPKTMKGKELVKRLLYGKLLPLPAELADGMAELYPLVPIKADGPVSQYKVIYAIGTKR